MRRWSVRCVTIAVALAAACGGEPGTQTQPDSGLPPHGDVSVIVAPVSVTLQPRQIQRFSADVANATDGTVTWSVTEGTAAGSVDSSGLYVAPSAEGTFHVVATSRADGRASATATVTVIAAPHISVTIAPMQASVSTGGTQRFTAAVSGSQDTAVSWSVVENDGGSVSDGMYTAPSSAGTYHVVAIAHADATKSATAEVTVLAPPPRPIGGVSIIPQSAILMAGDTQQFSAVAPAASGPVSLRVAEGSSGGSIDASLLYTAPATAGTYHVVATARDGSSAIGTVIVRASGATIAPGDVSVAPGGIVEFTTSRPADELIYWDVVQVNSQAGTINHGTGIYQAPETPGQYEVTASVYVTTSRASATVTVRPDPVYVTINMPVIEGAHPGDGAAYRATVHGTNDQRVIWSIVEPAGGTVDQFGNYTSPRDRAGVFHIVATSVAAPSATASAIYETCTGVGACGTQAKLKDGGGTILPTSVTYALFWGPSSAFPADLQPNVEAMLQGLDGSAYLAIADQYMRGAKTRTRFAGSLFDVTTPPATFDVDAEICRMLDANGVEPRLDAVYFLYASTPPMSSGYCAWHSYSTCNGVFIHTAYMPYPGLSATGTCENGLDLGCGPGPLTKEWISFTAHEFMESITDARPWRIGWYNWDRGEIADICGGTQACVPLGGKTFQIQGEFSNAADGCVAQ